MRPNFEVYLTACGHVATAKGLPCTITPKEVERVIRLQQAMSVKKISLGLSPFVCPEEIVEALKTLYSIRGENAATGN